MKDTISKQMPKRRLFWLLISLLLCFVNMVFTTCACGHQDGSVPGGIILLILAWAQFRGMDRWPWQDAIPTFFIRLFFLIVMRGLWLLVILMLVPPLMDWLWSGHAHVLPVNWYFWLKKNSLFWLPPLSATTLISLLLLIRHDYRLIRPPPPSGTPAGVQTP